MQLNLLTFRFTQTCKYWLNFLKSSHVFPINIAGLVDHFHNCDKNVVYILICECLKIIHFEWAPVLSFYYKTSVIEQFYFLNSEPIMFIFKQKITCQTVLINKTQFKQNAVFYLTWYLVHNSCQSFILDC